MINITPDHKTRFGEIRKTLSDLGCRETSFSRVELLFYEALTISRSYGNDLSENHLLYELKQLEVHQYQGTKLYFKKSSQREQAIRKFVARLKTILNIH